MLKFVEDGQELERPLHRVLVASKSLVYFQEAYRHPKLYNPIIGKMDLPSIKMMME